MNKKIIIKGKLGVMMNIIFYYGQLDSIVIDEKQNQKHLQKKIGFRYQVFFLVEMISNASIDLVKRNKI